MALYLVRAGSSGQFEETFIEDSRVGVENELMNGNSFMDTAENKESSLLSTLRELEKNLSALDQFILAKAFRGELVPQNPSDEPASELLTRIKMESADKKTTT